MKHPDNHHHDHGSHHGMVHEPSPETLAEYERAVSEAQPATGAGVVKIALEAKEADWEFVPGITTRVWGYNGQVPGPVIEARVGDVLAVRLTNRLPEGTMIHWHGIRLPAAMDGTENVQRPVPADGSYEYRFQLRDAGTFWYHSHINETIQLERGLYGALIVRGENEPLLDDERVLIVDDVALDDNGQFKPAGGWTERHAGREGPTLLVNGKSAVEFRMNGGQTERWRIINAASARYIRLSIGGRQFRILGTDGGLISKPETVTEVLLAPGDRFDLAVGPFEPNQSLTMDALEYDRGGGVEAKRETLAEITVLGNAASRARIPDTLRHIQPLVGRATVPTRVVKLAYRATHEGPAFTINGELHHRAEPVKLGELQVWDIVNESEADHPFHLHGYFFQVIEVNGRSRDYLSWEDTVNVPALGRVRIAWLPDDRPGEWMYHCHILEHHAGGMMAHFQVVE